MMLRKLTISCSAAIAAGVLATSLAASQQSGKPAGGHDMPMTAMASSPMTKAQKIANAVGAAPASISGKAAVLDWPAKEGAAPETLRPGSNGWTCFPDQPQTKGNDPMCVDETWMKWVDAYVAKKAPEITRVGIGYMLAPGGSWASNTDPYAMEAKPDNHWGHHESHIMILVPDAKGLAGISTDPSAGGPYVMWAGTPYVHIMAPTMAAPMKSMNKTAR